MPWSSVEMRLEGSRVWIVLMLLEKVVWLLLPFVLSLVFLFLQLLSDNSITKLMGFFPGNWIKNFHRLKCSLQCLPQIWFKKSFLFLRADKLTIKPLNLYNFLAKYIAQYIVNSIKGEILELFTVPSIMGKVTSV